MIEDTYRKQSEFYKESMEFVKYDSPEEVMNELFTANMEGVPIEDDDEIPVQESVVESRFMTVDSKGNEDTISDSEVLESIKKIGIWGWVEDKTNTIHLWCDTGRIKMEDMVFFLGHEIGHTIKEPDVPHTHDLDEEHRADGYAWAAKEAYRIASLIIG